MFLTALPKRFVNDRTYRYGWCFLIAGFVCSVPVMWQAVQTATPTTVVLFSAPWAVLPQVELHVDRLAAVMMLVISSIGMVLYRYSMRYLQQDGGQRRYMTLLALAISTLLLMVSSSDLIVLFIAWQLLSWILCLLSHNYAHTPTANSSFRTFIMLRAGDISFLAGIALAYHLYGTVQFTELFEKAQALQSQISVLGSGFTVDATTAVTFLIFIGAMSKSAQFPLHMWLPDSLYAPTPIHALLHAGIINAGGFLLNRLAPLYVLSPSTLHLVLVIGIATMLFGKSMMLVKSDIKKTLGYSTIGQMGYMIMECGLGAFSLAVFHLIAHGLFKATVFLNCGDVIHKTRLDPEQPIRPSPDTPSLLGWFSGFALSLIFPLAIVIGAHYMLGISFLDSQGMLIFLLFSWVTASHAMLTLFRLQDSASKMISMLVAVAFVSTAYFFAAEQFTHFLYPDHAIVTSYFQAAAIPHELFLALAIVLVLAIVLSWFGLYLHYHDKFVIRTGRLWISIYLFFINKLYLDGLSVRLFNSLKKIGKSIDKSKFAFPLLALCALAFVWPSLSGVSSESTILLLLISAFLLPLFPFHGVYLAALTKTPRLLAITLSLLLPASGLMLIGKLPPELTAAIGTLSLFGAIWGSVKALVQVRISRLLSYAGVALYSITWWHLAQVGQTTTHAILYTSSVTISIAGLLFIWDRLCARFGDLDLNNIGGLFKPMPRFALCTALLVMALIGLPPFGLFFFYLNFS